MKAPIHPPLLVLAALAGASWACFDGAGAIGAVCFSDSQCGVGQRCVNSVCGSCNDLVVQPGELCFGASSDENVFGEVADMVAFDPEGDGRPVLATVVNTNCEPLPETGPPDDEGPSCWNLELLLLADGSFEATKYFMAPRDGRVAQMTVGDFDGNSGLDLAVAVRSNDPLADPSQLGLFYDFPSTFMSLDISVDASAIHAADLNGDGLDDLLIAGNSSDAFTLLRSNGDGTFANEQLIVSLPNARPAPPADMNGDGTLDIVLTSNVTRELGVDLNNGNATFTPESRVAVEGMFLLSAPVIADFDRDGNMDVAVIGATGPNGDSIVGVFRGNGDGTVTLDQTLEGGELPLSAIAADVNFDGWPDIVEADTGEDKLPVHINREGEFPDVVYVKVAASPNALLHDDFDRDDIPDLAVGSINGVVSIVPSEN